MLTISGKFPICRYRFLCGDSGEESTQVQRSLSSAPSRTGAGVGTSVSQVGQRSLRAAVPIMGLNDKPWTSSGIPVNTRVMQPTITRRTLTTSARVGRLLCNFLPKSNIGKGIAFSRSTGLSYSKRVRLQICSGGAEPYSSAPLSSGLLD